ncbi:MAG TPA: MFS transporter [Spirochaetia bacterium]|nr:MFS transporter [Spirochaetia bacterium]
MEKSGEGYGTSMDGDLTRKHRNRLLLALMLPNMMIVFSGSMFTVALPAIRKAFALYADITALLVVAFTLSFIMFLPLYGRIGDALGRGRLFLIAIGLFTIGTLVALFAPDLRILIIGRMVQGAGAAGIHPLSLSIISGSFPSAERGKALGAWESVGPLTGVLGPILGGFLIDIWGWRTVFGPILLASALTFLVIYRLSPVVDTDPGRDKGSRFLASFDWAGVILLSLSMVFMVFYVSSRPVTGIEPFKDWRMLAVSLVLVGCFILWERSRKNPYIHLGLFRIRNFSLSSVCVSIRMFLLGGFNFLIPLYLADLYNLPAFLIGMLVMLNAGALFVAMWAGGILADRMRNRILIPVGILGQVGVMVFFALLPASSSLGFIGAGVFLHGLSAGVYLSALQHIYMRLVPQNRAGSAAGLHTMCRFFGSLLGSAVAGAFLQRGLDLGEQVISAYHSVFLILACVGIVSIPLSLIFEE